LEYLIKKCYSRKLPKNNVCIVSYIGNTSLAFCSVYAFGIAASLQAISLASFPALGTSGVKIPLMRMP